MTKEAIFERIVIIIKEQLHKPELDIKPSTTLQDDLGVDSISLMASSIFSNTLYRGDTGNPSVLM